MADLIDRKAAIDAIHRHIDSFDAIDKNYIDGLTTAIAFIKELPSAQPIIRCEDCKHRPVADDDWQDGFDIEFPDNRCPCQCDDGYYNWLPDDDWFCGNAERRTDGKAY